MDRRDLRTYSELIKLPTFQERFEYLVLNGSVGKETFGYDRYLNQRFYSSPEWKRIRDQIIVRDNGCDLGVDGRIIYGPIYIHHMKPISVIDIYTASELLTLPEFLICASFDTHNAIHYGDGSKLRSDPIERRPDDTCPWKE